MVGLDQNADLPKFKFHFKGDEEILVKISSVVSS